MKTVIIYDEKRKMATPEVKDAILLPIPDFLETEQRSTTVALQTARRMKADCIIIYRDK